MAEKSPLTLDNVINFPWEGASDPDLLPDGLHVVYACEGALWLVETAGSEPQRLTQGSRPRWSPAGDAIAFLRGDPAQLWLRDASGDERLMTEFAAGVVAFDWSPDGHRIAVVSPRSTPPFADREKGPATIVEVHRPSLSPGHSLMVMNAVTGEAEVVAESESGEEWRMVVWRPDGRRIALWERVLNRDPDEADHPVVVDLETCHMCFPAARSRRPGYFLCWSPDGTRLAFSHSPHDFVHPFRTVLGIVDAAGGDVTCFARDYFNEEVCGYVDDRTVCCLAGRGIGLQVLRVDTITGSVQPLTDGGGDHAHGRLSQDRKRLVCTYRTPATLPEVYLLSLDGGERRPLTQLNEHLSSFQLAETEIVRWPAPDGLEIQGILVKPLDYEPGQRYPTIVDLHGGPVGGVRADCRAEWHWLAAQGYLVFAPDFRGGQTYQWCPPLAEAEPGYEEYDFHDVMAGVDWLAKAGYADPERLGLRGFSYGACLGAWIIGHTDRFRAAVLEGGRYQWEVAYGTKPKGNALLVAEMGGSPWEVPEVYRRLSALTHIPNARTPTLIVQGELDQPVTAEMLYTWLYQQGVEVEYVKYLGEGHGLRKVEHRQDYWHRTLAWFDRHLGR